jgi:hypothetical protein
MPTTKRISWPDMPPGFPQPAYRALQQAGYRTLPDLDGASAESLLALHGFGPRGLRLLREALAAKGLRLAP